MKLPKFFLTSLLCIIALLQLNPASAHKLKGDPEAFDLLVRHSSPVDWQSGKFYHCQIAGSGRDAVISLKQKSPGKFFRKGYYESPPIDAGFLFHEILPSWNIEIPSFTGYAIQLAVKKDKGKWSDWYYIVGDGAPPGLPRKRLTKDDFGTIDVDYWMGDPVKFVKYKVWLFSPDNEYSPELKRFFLALRGNLKNNPNSSPPKKAMEVKLPDRFNNDVPFRYQSALASRRLWGMTCCPTSVAMVLDFFGHDADTTTAVQMCFDPERRIFGIWPRAAQTISQFGLVSYVRRFRNLHEARLQLAKGTPIIASIQTKKGDLPEALYDATPGHIIVISGYEGDDWFIVNDPASRNRAKCFQARYSASGIQKAWIDRGGVGIISLPEQK